MQQSLHNNNKTSQFRNQPPCTRNHSLATIATPHHSTFCYPLVLSIRITSTLGGITHTSKYHGAIDCLGTITQPPQHKAPLLLYSSTTSKSIPLDIV